MPDSDEIHAMKTALEEVKSIEGRGTELVSLYIPSGDGINSYVKRMSREYSEAENIKSDETRSNVQSAVSKVENILKQYKNTPENGIVVFAGRVDNDMKTFVFDNLPRELEHSNYVCSDEFDVGPIEDIIAPDASYGLLVIEKNEATIGELVGDSVYELRNIESGVMGKTKAGGQSQKRFERVREKQKQNFFRKVARETKEYLIEDDELNVDGLLLGGPKITIEDFRKSDYLDYRLEESIIAEKGVEYGNVQGLKELVRRSRDELREHEEQEAQKRMERFYEGLSSDNNDINVTYGRDDVETAIENGAVKTLLLSENLSPDEVSELKESVENQGGEAVIIPDSFDRGFALWDTFGGVAAVLRFDMSWAE